MSKLTTLKEVTQEIDNLTRLQIIMVESNKIIKRLGANPEFCTKQLIDKWQILGYGGNEYTASQLQQKDFAGRVGFPDYKLTNNSANIRRLKKRAIELDRKEHSAKGGNLQYTIPEGYIKINHDEDRVQVIFKNIPDVDVRNKLKSNGFKWSPSNQAWQRMITQNTISTINYLFKTSISL